jgi:hypothetical protein
MQRAASFRLYACKVVIEPDVRGWVLIHQQRQNDWGAQSDAVDWWVFELFSCTLTTAWHDQAPFQGHTVASSAFLFISRRHVRPPAAEKDLVY